MKIMCFNATKFESSAHIKCYEYAKVISINSKRSTKYCKICQVSILKIAAGVPMKILMKVTFSWWFFFSLSFNFHFTSLFIVVKELLEYILCGFYILLHHKMLFSISLHIFSNEVTHVKWQHSALFCRRSKFIIQIFITKHFIILSFKYNFLLFFLMKSNFRYISLSFWNQSINVCLQFSLFIHFLSKICFQCQNLIN